MAALLSISLDEIPAVIQLTITLTVSGLHWLSVFVLIAFLFKRHHLNSV